jgi:hypothetical protein
MNQEFKGNALRNQHKESYYPNFSTIFLRKNFSKYLKKRGKIIQFYDIKPEGRGLDSR